MCKTWKKLDQQPRASRARSNGSFIWSEKKISYLCEMPSVKLMIFLLLADGTEKSLSYVDLKLDGLLIIAFYGILKFIKTVLRKKTIMRVFLVPTGHRKITLLQSALRVRSHSIRCAITFQLFHSQYAALNFCHHPCSTAWYAVKWCTTRSLNERRLWLRGCRSSSCRQSHCKFTFSETMYTHPLNY